MTKAKMKVLKLSGKTRVIDEKSEETNEPQDDQEMEAALIDMFNGSAIAPISTHSAYTFKEKGLLTNDKGVVLKLESGKVFYLTIQEA